MRIDIKETGGKFFQCKETQEKLEALSLSSGFIL